MSEIYALSDDVLSPDYKIKEDLLSLLKCGLKMYQYRSKKLHTNINLIKELSQMCKSFKAKFIINDNICLAKEVDADGVHLGKDDENIKKAREILGKNSIIGASSYNDLNLALNLEKMGANYIAFGAVFPSKTKPDANIVDLNLIRKAKKILKIPICLIGGINSQNIEKLKGLSDYLAIVNAIYQPKSVSENFENLRKKL